MRRHILEIAAYICTPTELLCYINSRPILLILTTHSTKHSRDMNPVCKWKLQQKWMRCLKMQPPFQTHGVLVRIELKWRYNIPMSTRQTRQFFIKFEAYLLSPQPRCPPDILDIFCFDVTTDRRILCGTGAYMEAV